MKNYKIVLSILSILTLLVLNPQVYPQGTTAGNFIKIPVNAKISACGDTGATKTNTSASMLYNPSLLVFLQQKEFVLTHMEYIQSKYETFLYAQPIKDFVTLGVFLGYLYTQEITKTIIDKTQQEGYKKIGVYTNNFKTAVVSVAKNLTETDLNLGLSLRYIQEQLADSTAESGSVDIGISYKIKNFVFSGSLQNFLHSSIKFINEQEELPVIFRFGYEYTAKKFTINNEFDFTSDKKFYIKLGAEYNLWDVFSLSVGYKYSDLINYLGFVSGINTGFGIKFVDYQLYYSLSTFGDFGLVHTITFSGRF